MTISDEISIIANKLANEGKKPSVALIKSKLTQPVNLPTIIQTLKSWQHDPEFITFKQSEQPTNKIKATATSEDQTSSLALEQAINRAIKPLQQEISQLKALVETLIAKA